MVSASVGFQCPECAHAGAKAQRLVDVHRHATQPVVTKVLIAINVLVFLVQTGMGNNFAHGLYPDFFSRFSLWAGTALLTDHSVATVGVANGEWWRVITGGFMHANFIHIGFNMFALYNVGSILEAMIGRVRFALIYGVSLIGGACGALLLSSPTTPTVGASGAIFGVFGALVFLQLSRGIPLSQGGILPTIAINLVITFSFHSVISVGGHIGGLLTGSVVAFLLIGASVSSARHREQSLNVMIPIVAVLGVALFTLSIWGAYYVVAHGALLSIN